MFIYSTRLLSKLSSSQFYLQYRFKSKTLVNFTRKKLTNEISFITNASAGGVTKLRLKNDNNPLTLDYKSNGRPLSVLPVWLMAADKTVDKYTNIYIKGGFDVLTVRITPLQLAWPANAIHVAENLLQFLDQTDHQNKFVHGFSVGGHVFNQMLYRAAQEPKRYHKVLRSFKGQIWESIVDTTGAPIGISKTMFPNTFILQITLQKMIELHMFLMRPWVTKYYQQSHDTHYRHPLRVPCMYLSSENDEISSPQFVQKLSSVWRDQIGIDTRVKIWTDTEHLENFKKHPDEYLQVVHEFWKHVGLPETLAKSESPKLVLETPDGVAPRVRSKFEKIPGKNLQNDDTEERVRVAIKMSN